MCGIAGMGNMQIYMPGQGIHTSIDFHGRAPLAVRPDMWADRILHEAQDGWGFILKDRVNEIGYQAVTTPMSLRAFDIALRRFGTRSLADFHGTRDLSLLQSALARPRQSLPYGSEPQIISLAAGYTFGIIRNHPFTDGNKRTGFVAGILFLELNGYRFTATEEDAAQAVLSVAAGHT
jgi:death-on-curing family protein